MAPYQMSVSGPLLEKLLDGPAAVPPPGHVSDLHIPNQFALTNHVCLVLFLVINTCVIFVRLFTQQFLLKGLVIEDYVVVLAWLFQIGENIAGFICIQDGAGKHMWNISIRDALKVKMVANHVGIMYGISMLFIKVAILLQFLRLFTRGGHNRALKIACWVWIALNTIYYLLDTLLQAMQCLPREKIWNPFIVGGHCLSTEDIWGATGVFNVISDVAILLLPLPSIYKLQLAKGKKVFIMGIFATGIVACVASTMRTYYTYRTFETPDETYYMFFIGVWTWIEMCIGIIIFCLPVIPHFIHCVRAKTSGLFASFVPSQAGSQSASSLEQPPTPTSDAKVARATSKAFPYVDVSLASFEQRPAAREDSGIHVMRSISFMTERTEGE